MRCFAWLPSGVEIPLAVQHNANGEMVVRLRGWGNEPTLLGNWDKTNFSATIPLEKG